MELLLDTANINEIKRCREYYPLTGITTNPSILAKEERGFREQMELVKQAAGDRRHGRRHSVGGGGGGPGIRQKYLH